MRFRTCLATVLVAFVAGCGGDDEGNGGATPEPAGGGNGGGDAAQLFKDNCANCHTLAAAGTTGQVGPNLDQLAPSANLVNTQVTNGGGGMPPFKGKLSEEQIQQISDYVAENAGQS
jgi:mono/diheme cytochrome c family protein